MNYDPATGLFRRLIVRSARAGHGGLRDNGYLRMMVDGHHATCHRWAWYYMTGEWPQHEIDHIDGVRTNNRWANLRAASRQENAQNRRRPDRDSRTGVLGVTRTHSKRNPFAAQISVGNKTRRIGCFATAEDAHAAYVAAKRRLHEGCTL